MNDFDTYYLLSLRYLNIRFRSEKEIRDYLKKKLSHHSGKQGASRIDSGQADDQGLIDLIVHKLKQQKFLNDEEFAKMWIRSSTNYKPKGKYRIVQELRLKGITQEIIDKVLVDSEVREKNEKELATEVLERKKKKYEGMETQERFNKVGQMLARRGFDLDSIKAAIDEVFSK